MNRVTKFIDLGRKSYREVWQQQEELLEMVKEQKKQEERTSNYLLFVYFGKERGRWEYADECHSAKGQTCRIY